MSLRTVFTRYAALHDDIGYLHVRRVLPGIVEQIDPFVSFAHYGPQPYPSRTGAYAFGTRPYRGFEEALFVLAGELEYRDDCGLQGVVPPGGVKWVSAGAGIMQREDVAAGFARTSGRFELLRLWINLPAAAKKNPPSSRILRREDLSCMALHGGDVVIDLVAGELGGRHGPVRSAIDLTLFMVRMRKGQSVRVPAPRQHTACVYLLRGSVALSGTLVKPQQFARLNNDGDAFELVAFERAVMLVAVAPPLNEPLVAFGPFIMNTQTEIEQAVADYQLI